MHGYVLNKFAKYERDAIDKTLEYIVRAVPSLFTGNDADFTTKLGLLMKPKKVNPAPEDKLIQEDKDGL